MKRFRPAGRRTGERPARREEPRTERPAGEQRYKVGYGKPPLHTRFKPGRSGNPKGRPKGVRNFGTDLKATLNAPVKLLRDGKPRRVSTQEAMLLRLREKALSGDARALDRLIALAQTYNNENPTAVAGLSNDDAQLLEVFKARVLSGAAGRTQARTDVSNVPDSAISRPTNFEWDPNAEAAPERVRPQEMPHKAPPAEEGNND